VTALSADAEEKFRRLLGLLSEEGTGLLAFSGGVDSAFLLKAMVMSGLKMLAVTAESETLPEGDLRSAREIAKALGVNHRVIRSEELMNEAFASNPPDRCFHCKDGLFTKLCILAEKESLVTVFDGSNADDLSDYRPGLEAARLHGVRSPLAECGFTKAEIREMSRRLGLQTWDRPSSPCLSSRFPYGRRITAEGLKRVAEAERFLDSLGIRELRVRDHGDTARIEVREEDAGRVLEPENRKKIVAKLRSLGYAFVALDLEGFRSGSLNRVLAGRETRPVPH
jgi:uncharacterized protein